MCAADADDADRLGSVRYDLIRFRNLFLNHFTLIIYGAVFCSRLYTIDRKCNLFICRMSIDINRIIRIIHKYKILAGGFCNRRIRRRIYIGYDHGMIVTFCHFQLCPQNRIVQRCGYLTDTAADAVYHLAVQIRTRHLVTIFGGEGLHCIIGRKRIAGIQSCSVDQAAAICNVFAAGRPGG